ncbi:CD151 antigen-like [Anoplophora glabripennis]|uniref:CD151 antigen-like n=1 Tax=Anoplophora glabripennis TaxID=217634 RepID=UPI0008735E97|nr:CD151 antigen-like [Anoplophora glabripennis]
MGSGKCCGVSAIKAVLYVFQFVFLVTGLALCVIGVWAFLRTFHFMNVLDSTAYSSTIFLFISTGCLVILVAILGCCAIPKHRTKLLFCYTLFLVLIFLMEALVGVLSYIYQENIDEEMNLRFNSTLLTTYKQMDGKTESIDVIQQRLACCGAESYQDWKYSNWLQNTAVLNKVPDSCCKSILYECGIRDHPSNIFLEGCSEPVASQLKWFLWLICAVSLGFCLIQVIGIIFGIVLFLKLESGLEYEPNDTPSGNETLLSERQL